MYVLFVMSISFYVIYLISGVVDSKKELSIDSKLEQAQRSVEDFDSAYRERFLERPYNSLLVRPFGADSNTLDVQSSIMFVNPDPISNGFNNGYGSTSDLSSPFPYGNYDLNTYIGGIYGGELGGGFGTSGVSGLTYLITNGGDFPGTSGAINPSGMASVKVGAISRYIGKRSGSNGLSDANIDDVGALDNSEFNFYNNGISFLRQGEFEFNPLFKSKIFNTADYYPKLVSTIKAQHNRTLSRFAEYYSFYGSFPIIYSAPAGAFGEYVSTSSSNISSSTTVGTSITYPRLVVGATLALPSGGVGQVRASANPVSNEDARACSGIFLLRSQQNNVSLNLPLGCEDIWNAFGTMNKFYIFNNRVVIESRATSGTLSKSDSSSTRFIKDSDNQDLRVITELDLS